jgi:hypothetical protein
VLPVSGWQVRDRGGEGDDGVTCTAMCACLVTWQVEQVPLAAEALRGRLAAANPVPRLEEAAVVHPASRRPHSAGQCAVRTPLGAVSMLQDLPGLTSEATMRLPFVASTGCFAVATSTVGIQQPGPSRHGVGTQGVRARVSSSGQTTLQPASTQSLPSPLSPTLRCPPPPLPQGDIRTLEVPADPGRRQVAGSLPGLAAAPVVQPSHRSVQDSMEPEVPPTSAPPLQIAFVCDVGLIRCPLPLCRVAGPA